MTTGKDRTPGSAKEAFVVPTGFDEPLPAEVLADWEPASCDSVSDAGGGEQRARA